MTNVPAPAPPTLVNTTATLLNDAIKEVESLLAPAIKTATIAAIDAAVPELALPIVDDIVNAAVGAAESVIENYLTKIVETGTTFLVVDVQTGEENETIVEARKAFILALASGNAEAIAQAKENYANAQSSLVRDDGSATPQ